MKRTFAAALLLLAGGAMAVDTLYFSKTPAPEQVYPHVSIPPMDDWIPGTFCTTAACLVQTFPSLSCIAPAIPAMVPTGGLTYRLECVTEKHTNKSDDTQWVGHPMFSDNDPYTPSEGWLTHIEFGLRPDGVVVWRKKP